MTNGAPKMFLSYRREETAAYAGRLYDALAERIGDANVFMDIEHEPGIDFVERITQVIGACHVLLVIVGPQWATLASGEEHARIAQEDDFVRLEVEAALRRPSVRVIRCWSRARACPTRAICPNRCVESLAETRSS